MNGGAGGESQVGTIGSGVGTIVMSAAGDVPMTTSATNTASTSIDAPMGDEELAQWLKQLNFDQDTIDKVRLKRSCSIHFGALEYLFLREGPLGHGPSGNTASQNPLH